MNFREVWEPRGWTCYRDVQQAPPDEDVRRICVRDLANPAAPFRASCAWYLASQFPNEFAALADCYAADPDLEVRQSVAEFIAQSDLQRGLRMMVDNLVLLAERRQPGLHALYESLELWLCEHGAREHLEEIELRCPRDISRVIRECIHARLETRAADD